MSRLSKPRGAGLLVGFLLCLPAVPGNAQEDDDLLDELMPETETVDPTEPEPETEPVLEEEVEAVPAEAETTAGEAVAVEPEDTAAEDSVQNNPAAYDRIKAVPKKAVLKIGRVELSGFGAFSMNDAYWQHFALSGTVIYYPHDAFGLGIGIDYLFNHADTDNIEVVRQSLTSVPAVFEPPRLFAHIDMYWVPIYGKVSLFDTWIIHFDFYGTAGVGIATAFGDRRPPAVNAGLGQRFFLADWLALRFEVRDHVFVDTLSVDQQPWSDIQSYVLFMAGASFYIPPSFEYSYL